MDAGGTEEAVERGGIPGAFSNAVGDATRAAQSDSWWLLAVGIPLLLWAGFTGAKAAVLIIRSSGRDPATHQAPPELAFLHRHGVRLPGCGGVHLVGA